tara:strand:+ start:351 stop:815 length:465 start_codon:yes stop_codon:yes gene_type:complete
MHFELTADDDAMEETYDAILGGYSLPPVLRRCRDVDVPVTRGETYQTVATCDNAQRVMRAIYCQYGILCTMIQDVCDHDGIGVPDNYHAVIQDFHTEVLDNLAFRLLNHFQFQSPAAFVTNRVNSRDTTQAWVCMTNRLLTRWLKMCQGAYQLS